MKILPVDASRFVKQLNRRGSRDSYSFPNENEESKSITPVSSLCTYGDLI